MTSLDTNVSNYSLSELLTIVDLDNEDVNEDSILSKTNHFINKFKNKSKSKLHLIFIIMLFPSIFFYIIAIDWGRWVNISYTLSLFTFIYLLKNKYIKININKLNKINHKINNHKNLLLFLFFLYAFCWNPKILIDDKTVSFPLYRVIYKVYKISL